MGSAEKFPNAGLLRQSWDSSPPASVVLQLGLPEQSSVSSKRLQSSQLNGHAPSPNKITLDQLAELKAILRKRDLLVEKRISLNVLKRNCIPHRNYNREVLKAFQDAWRLWRTSVRSSQTNDDSFLMLERALEQLEKSYPSLLGIEEQVRQAENELNVLEKHLQKREHKLYNKWRKLVDTQVSKDSDSESSSTYSKPSTGASSSPSIAREYYSQAKQAFILRGRLRDFQEAHHQEMETRKRDQDLSQPVEPSEKIFVETYLTELITMYKEYYNTRERATQLKAQCRQLGIKVEDEQDTASNVDALDGQTRIERSVIHEIAMRKSNFGGIAELEELLFGYTDSNARVEEWRANLPLHYQQDEPRNTNVDDHRNFLWDTVGRRTSPTFGLQDVPGITHIEHLERLGTIPKASGVQAYISRPKIVEDARFPGDPLRRRYSYSILSALDKSFDDCSIDVTLPSRPKSIR
jgi:hypothetical protein